ncbi:MAG: two-component sensor histidine kinase, partial [Alteromonadales bacterium]|nr:two-component sensor histidine kinase [Alteromonadales bacterium]
QYFANSKNVTITFKDKVSSPILADVKLLASVINNVVNNAVKYSPNNNEVTVTLRKQLSDQHKQIVLTVSDHGPGVPDDVITELFSPFFRVADGRERSSGGTGLGLAIAQQGIHLHQGEIYAQNRKGNGLKVTIILPLPNS